jgi:hypothetical protein
MCHASPRLPRAPPPRARRCRHRAPAPRRRRSPPAPRAPGAPRSDRTGRDLRRGDEVAGGAQLGRAAAVVAEPRRVQGELHVAAEADRAAGANDLLVDAALSKRIAARERLGRRAGGAPGRPPDRGLKIELGDSGGKVRDNGVARTATDERRILHERDKHGQTLAGRTALVTGGARRLGAALAQALHGAGANVVIHYRGSRDATPRRSPPGSRPAAPGLDRAGPGRPARHRRAAGHRRARRGRLGRAATSS